MLALPKKAGRSVLSAQKVRSSEINIVLVSDSEIKKLNTKFRKVRRITDVISFKFSPRPLTGDIYIALGRSRKQAREAGHCWEKEISYLVIHGILHLLGYTDYTPKEKRRMFKEQDKIYTDLCIGNGTLETHI